MSEKFSMGKSALAAYLSFIMMAALFMYHIFSASSEVRSMLGMMFSNEAKTAFPLIFAVYLVCFYLMNRKLKPEERTVKFATSMHLIAFSILLLFSFFDAIYTLAAVLVISLAFVWVKIFNLRDLIKVFFAFFIIFIAASTMFQPAVVISKGQGTVLTDNWWNAFLWIKNNTEECAVVATYWDPGHFITGIANRAAVFDGASQNTLWNITLDANATEEQIRDAAVIDRYTVRDITVNGEKKKLVETARIQDIATALYTSNETLAVRILEKYIKPGCDEMYFLATADLIGKSYWWTYFSTWNPIEKGCATPMSQMPLVQTRPVSGGGTSYIYEGGIPVGCNQQAGGQVVIVDKGNDTGAYVLTNNNLELVERFVFFTAQGGFVKTQPDAPVKGMVILDPSGQAVIFVPKEIQDAMFTKMFFFNGQGLENFELVNSWGGEVKLFKMVLNSTQSP